MQTMTNWSNFSGNSVGARVTTWNYDPYRGFLTSKAYADGHGPSYTYTPAGRLQTRTWARGITTTYTYDIGGDLQTVVYSDNTTPNATYTYDRLGRESTITWNGITDTMTYNLANQLLGELYSGGILNGLSVTNGYDSDLRRTALAALTGSSQLLSAAYGYDNASRPSTVSDGTDNVTYSYLAYSPLVSQITFKSNSVTRMTTSKQYDYLNRLTSISSAPAAAAAVLFNYNYNAANQRTRDTLADGSYWLYQYDSLGQVIGANKYWSDETPVAGQQFDYAFDTIGNRIQTQSGGDQHGGFLRMANYTNNTLNQITSRDVPGYVDVKGVSFATNTVTVNSQTAYRKVEYFRDELAVNNSSSALWTNIIVAGTGQTSVTGNVYVAQEPEVFSYDADGNLTNDGRFSWTWDGENRLINLTSLSSAPTGSKVKLDFVYDYQGRRIQKLVSTNSGSAYVAQYTNRFLYDGWNMIAEVQPNNSLIRSYVWGSDLSGSMQGAGGVGGLLEASYYGSATTNCFPAFDGNGNVAALVNAADGTVAANYEYGPFGELIRTTGPMARTNPFRFSTKNQDDESDLLYYGYRYYDPSTGRWLSRDPVGEPGFGMLPSDYTHDAEGNPNFYTFVANNPIEQVDDLGLALYAIDGTWTTAPAMSNPWMLYHWTSEYPARYYPGPKDGPSGIDTGHIALNVYKQICSDYCSVGGTSFTINLTGWSRGAVAAVLVAQLLNERGCNCGCGWDKPIPVNWIGLFDAVNMRFVEPPMAVPSNVAHFYHAVKTSTSQWYYPTFHFTGGTEYRVFNYRAPYLTSHSDVGESVIKGNINDAYPWIENSAVASGVKFQ